MATAPLKPCAVPFCPKLVPAGKRYCDRHADRLGRAQANEHARARRQKRATPTNVARWRKRRVNFLMQYPHCLICFCAGAFYRPATVVDHVDANDTGDNSDANLLPLCLSCHSTITNKYDGGGGRPVDTAGKRAYLEQITDLRPYPHRQAGGAGYMNRAGRVRRREK